MQQMTEADFLTLLESLLDRHNIFTRLWKAGKIYFTKVIPTAAVCLRNDHIEFLLNEEFWNNLSSTEKTFVICHEQLHLILDHFSRLQFNSTDTKEENRIKNIAADLAVNHTLVRQFNFKRTDLSSWEKYCWVDTVFTTPVSDNETANYYYSLLTSNMNTNPDVQTVDDHQVDPSIIPEPWFADMVDEILDELKNGNIKLPGVIFGDEELLSSQKKAPEKKKWQTIYKQIVKKLTKEKEYTHWVNTDRRFTVLGKDIILPGSAEQNEVDVVNLRIYLDTSGSCIDDAEKFLKTALTLPPTHFNVQLFGFTTDVYPIEIEDGKYKLKGFGGTSFDCIKQNVETVDYDAIFIFTDGEAGKIDVSNPKKWFWFILPEGTANYIDPKCNIIWLQQYIW